MQKQIFYHAQGGPLAVVGDVINMQMCIFISIKHFSLQINNPKSLSYQMKWNIH